MLLTLKPPSQIELKSPHDHHPVLNSSSSRYSPPPTLGTSATLLDHVDSRMANPHRGLPPPAAMTLPPPSGNLPAMAPLNQLPAPPTQWAGADESMRNWLHAKAEEDKRKQEEEKTKQEAMKLDQRRVEQTMLRESLQGGVPPVMVPLIFAGMGGGNLSTQSLEWAQHYMAQISLQQSLQQGQQQSQQVQAQQPVQQQQVQQQQHSVNAEEIRRDARAIPSPYPTPLQIQPAQPPPPLPPPSQSPMATQTTQSVLPRQGIGLRTSPTSSTLSRLNTVELHTQGPTTGSGSAALSSQGSHALQQNQPAPSETQQTQASPSIYFHHWVPPNTNSTQNPPTPSTSKSQHSSPFSQNASSHLRSDYQNSPKKRKATGGHHSTPAPAQGPAPTSQPEASPQFSQGSARGRESSLTGQRRGNRDQSQPRSERSSSRGFKGHPIARPSSRQNRRDRGVEGEQRHRRDRKAGGSSASTSGDEHQLRILGVSSETQPVPLSAGR